MRCKTSRNIPNVTDVVTSSKNAEITGYISAFLQHHLQNILHLLNKISYGITDKYTSANTSTQKQFISDLLNHSKSSVLDNTRQFTSL